MSRDLFRSYVADHIGDLPPPPSVAQEGPPPVLPPPPGLPPLPEAPKSQGDGLPPFLRASDINPKRIVLPDILIAGLMHRGCKMILSGGSKSFKSWVLMHLGICMAHAANWWGLKTTRGTVLYLNFELIDGFFEERVAAICRAMGCELPSNFLYWNLRGHCYDLELLAKVIMQRIIATGPIDLIVVDPVYKALGDLDENSASDMTRLMNLIEAISVNIGAAVAFGSHFAKGNSAGKEVRDRAAGSGVLGRDPDVILALTRHEVDDCYAIESELRYLPRLAPFVVRWSFPIMVPDESLDPRRLHQGAGVPALNGARDEVQVPFTDAEVLARLPIGGAQDALWRKCMIDAHGRAGPDYYACKASLLKSGQVVKRDQKYFHSNLSLQPT